MTHLPPRRASKAPTRDVGHISGRSPPVFPERDAAGDETKRATAHLSARNCRLDSRILGYTQQGSIRRHFVRVRPHSRSRSAALIKVLRVTNTSTHPHCSLTLTSDRLSVIAHPSLLSSTHGVHQRRTEIRATSALQSYRRPFVVEALVLPAQQGPAAKGARCCP